LCFIITMTTSNHNQLSIIEKMTLIFVVIILIIGFILFYENINLFVRYVEEDGIVEWLTVLGLLLGCIVSFRRFFKLMRKRTAWFLLVTFLIGLVLFFGAGEEISWGQRILGLKSPEFFNKNNAQHETNFHNLIVDGVKLNKVIFSVMLSIAMGIYLVVVPLLYRTSLKIKSLINRSGIPVARLYQVISFISLVIITGLLKHEKNAELLECGTAFLFFLIIRYPKNIMIFSGSSLPVDHL
jgi:hypothetical protein